MTGAAFGEVGSEKQHAMVVTVRQFEISSRA